VINFAAAGSEASGQPGEQFSLGAQRIGRKFSLGASAIMANRNYRDVASLNGSVISRKQVSALTSLSLKRFGSVGAAYAGLDQDAPPLLLSVGAAAAQHSKVLSANYSIQFHHVSLYATGFNDFANTSGSSQFQVGLTIPFGRRSSVSLSESSGGSGQVQVQQPAPLINEWGYQAYFSGDSTDHEFGQVLYKSPVGLFTAGVDNDAGVTTTRLEADGAFSFVDGALFPSNFVYDSFAIVDTAPLPHIHVEQENRDVGRTNSSGRLLVPDMRSFELNHVAIVPTDVPEDATISIVDQEFRPQDRSGVVVRFPIKFSHAALLRLIDEAGGAIPIGSTATLRATGAIFPVGYDGDAYVEALSPHNELTIKRPDGRSCTVLFDYRPIPGEIPSLGPLYCMEKKP
jgi:outer membrane usher protein